MTTGLKLQNLFILVLRRLTLILLLLGSCRSTAQFARTPTMAGTPPDEARLRARIQSLYTAIEAKDIDTWYAMRPPYVRAQMPLESFKKDEYLRKAFDRKGVTAVPKRVHADVEEVCVCGTGVFALPDRPVTTRCTLLVLTTKDEPGGSQTKAKTFDGWEFIDDEWYQYWSEPGSICPKRPRG